MLPVNGEILVHVGQQVNALDVVARTELSHRYRVIDIARQLAQPNVNMDQVMLKAVGDTIKANEIMATTRGAFPFLHRNVRTPATGRIAAVGPGWVLLETQRTIVEVQAFIGGVVSKIFPQRGVNIEAHGAIIEAACGFGGEAFGRLQCPVTSPKESLSIAMLNEEVKQTILLAGCSVDETVLRQAELMQVRGIIVGSIDASLMKLEPPVRVRVVATEGFGQVPMSAYTFDQLTRLNGRDVSIRGQTPALAAANNDSKIEPPIIFATSSHDYQAPVQPADDQSTTEIRVGSRVRVTRGKHLGAIGHIVSLPAEPQFVESGLMASGAYVAIDEHVHYIPWVNLQQVN